MAISPSTWIITWSGQVRSDLNAYATHRGVEHAGPRTQRGQVRRSSGWVTAGTRKQISGQTDSA
jgi:hypothetical protein